MEAEEVELYLPEEVAEFFRVSPKTVSKWAKKGLVPSIVLPGRRRRYPVKEINKLLEVEKVAKYVECEECEGDGQCPECNGSGEQGNDNCPSCDGSGTCQECNGIGEIEDEDEQEPEYA